MTKPTSDSASQAGLKGALDELCADHKSFPLGGKIEEPGVALSGPASAGLEETAYLLRSPENARRLFRALHGDREVDVCFANVLELRARVFGD